MRILMLTSDPAGMGANFVRATGLGRALAAAGHRVTVMAAAPVQPIRGDHRLAPAMEVIHSTGGDPRPLRKSGFGLFDLAARLTRLRRMPFDVVHVFGHRPSAWVPVVVLGKRLGLPVGDWADLFGWGGIADERSSLGRTTVGRVDTWLEGHRRRWAHGVTVATRHLVQLALARGFRAGEVLNMRGGASVDLIRPMAHEAARARYGLPRDVPVVLHAGLSAWDLPLVTATFDEIARAEPKAMFVLVGATNEAAAAPSGPREWMKRLVTIPYVAHEQLGQALACADVMLLPFPSRGMNLGRFPARAGDYLASARPIVTNPTGDLGDFIRSEEAGLVVGDDPRVMAEAVQALFDDPSRARRLGENGRLAAERRLAWPLVATEVLAFYQRLLGNG